MDLQQQLMEFVYGLLDEDEANALSERITSDPEVARAYSKVKLQCDLVGRAAKIDEPTVAWMRPNEAGSDNTQSEVALQDTSIAFYRRLSNWSVAIAASLLICLMSASLFTTTAPPPSVESAVAVAATTPVSLTVTGPSRLHGEVGNKFAVRVANEADSPIATTLDYKVYDDQDNVRWSKSGQTNLDGLAWFDIDADVATDAARLEVTSFDAPSQALTRELDTAAGRYMAYLRTDRPMYQPGESLFFRTVTLSEVRLDADAEVQTRFEVVASNDKKVEGATSEVVTKDGVADGKFDLPEDLPDGEYSLLASSPDGQFRQEWRDFRVEHYAVPKYNKKLELAKDSYTAGDQVDLDFSVSGVTGKPIANRQLKIAATLDDNLIETPEATTNEKGESRISLQLPDTIDVGKASVSVTVDDGSNPAETITKPIPINLGKVNIDFFAEGGDLVAGLPNRVYFYGRDSLGKPTHIEGSIVDSAGNKLTDVATTHEGRGSFALLPTEDEYRLMIDEPVGVTKEVRLPAASSDYFATINTGPGVFEPDAPITYTIHQQLPAKPLNIAAYCRGAMVSQQPIWPEAFTSDSNKFGTASGDLVLPKEAQGVIRLTVFDASVSPARPIAERLVYRRVGYKLAVQLDSDSDSFKPEQSVELAVTVRDETGSPVPAVLGISIVDDAVLNLADDKSTRMPTYFHLLSSIDSSQRFEDANFYLSDEPDSGPALDALLGTQGWRRFSNNTPPLLVQGKSGEDFFAGGFGGGVSGGGGFGGGAGSGNKDLFASNAPESRYRFAMLGEEMAIPHTTEATIVANEAVAKKSRPSQVIKTSNMQRLRLPIMTGGALLLVLVIVASFVPGRATRPVRFFASVVAVTAIAIGLLSLPAKRATSGAVANVADSPYRSTVMYDAEMAMDAGEENSVAFSAAAGALEEEGSAEQPMLHEDKAFAYQVPEMEAAPAEKAEADADLPLAATASDDAMPKQRQLGRDDIVRQALKSKAVPDAMKGGQPDDFADRNKAQSLPVPAAQAPTDEPAAPPLAMQEQVEPQLADQQLMLQPQGDSLTRRFHRFQSNLEVAREYADWLYNNDRYDIPDVAPLGEPSATIFWHPRFLVDDRGQAKLFVNLPKRPSSFRVIVEAHGAGRLGSGEMLIDSR